MRAGYIRFYNCSVKVKSAFMALLLTGCATAPVGFYESAFPTEMPMSMGLTSDLGRRYLGIPYDTTGRGGTPHGFLILPSASLSPVSWLTVSADFTSAFTARMIRIKPTVFATDGMAAALVFSGGRVKGEGDDSWSPMPWGIWDDYGDTTRYEITNLCGGAIFSFCPQGWYTSQVQPRIILNIGPKLFFANMDYYRVVHTEDPKDSILTYQFSGNVWDPGGFMGTSVEWGHGEWDLEFSVLSVERPLLGKRTWTPYAGGKLRLKF